MHLVQILDVWTLKDNTRVSRYWGWTTPYHVVGCWQLGMPGHQVPKGHKRAVKFHGAWFYWSVCLATRLSGAPVVYRVSQASPGGGGKERVLQSRS